MNSYFGDLKEIFIYHILPLLSTTELASICSINLYINELCDDDRLWFRKVELEFPDYLLVKSDVVRWRDFYIDISIPVVVPYFVHPQGPEFYEFCRDMDGACGVFDDFFIFRGPYHLVKFVNGENILPPHPPLIVAFLSPIPDYDHPYYLISASLADVDETEIRQFDNEIEILDHDQESLYDTFINQIEYFLTQHDLKNYSSFT